MLRGSARNDGFWGARHSGLYHWQVAKKKRGILTRKQLAVGIYRCLLNDGVAMDTCLTIWTHLRKHRISHYCTGCDNLCLNVRTKVLFLFCDFTSAPIQASCRVYLKKKEEVSMLKLVLHSLILIGSCHYHLCFLQLASAAETCSNKHILLELSFWGSLSFQSVKLSQGLFFWTRPKNRVHYCCASLSLVRAGLTLTLTWLTFTHLKPAPVKS